MQGEQLDDRMRLAFVRWASEASEGRRATERPFPPRELKPTVRFDAIASKLQTQHSRVDALFDLCLRRGLDVVRDKAEPDYYPKITYHVGEHHGPTRRHLESLAAMIDLDLPFEDKVVCAVYLLLSHPKITASSLRIAHIAISAKQYMRGKRSWRHIPKAYLQVIDASPYNLLGDRTVFGKPRLEAVRQIVKQQLDMVVQAPGGPRD